MEITKVIILILNNDKVQLHKIGYIYFCLLYHENEMMTKTREVLERELKNDWWVKDGFHDQGGLQIIQLYSHYSCYLKFQLTSNSNRVTK